MLFNFTFEKSSLDSPSQLLKQNIFITISDNLNAETSCDLFTYERPKICAIFKRSISGLFLSVFYLWHLSLQLNYMLMPGSNSSTFWFEKRLSDPLCPYCRGCLFERFSIKVTKIILQMVLVTTDWGNYYYAKYVLLEI